MTRYKYRPGFSFEIGREYTLGEILECFSPIEEPQELTPEKIKELVEYSVKKYGQTYKDLEKIDGPDQPQEIEKLEQDFTNDRWDYKPEEFGEKINEIIDMLNSMRKGER